MKLRKKLRSFLETLHEAGPAATLTYAADQFLRLLTVGEIRRYLFFSQPVGLTIEPRMLARNVTCRELQNDDFVDLPQRSEVIADWLSQGATAVGAFKNGNAIGVIWYTVGSFVEDEVRAVYEPLPEGLAAWDFGVEILPEYRLGRTFLTLWSGAMDSMRARGCRYTLSRINAISAASVRAHRRLGAVPIGHATFFRIGRLQIAWSDCSPRIHFSFTADNRPRYRLPAEPTSAGECEPTTG